MLKFKRTFEHDLPIPEYATEGAAAMDISSSVSSYINPGQRAVIGTGWSVAIPSGFEIQVRPRSGLAAKHGITVLNTPGTIDSDYRGEIKICLINHGPALYQVTKGDRIAQLVLARIERQDRYEVQELDDTVRGSGGFGSTGFSLRAMSAYEWLKQPKYAATQILDPDGWRHSDGVTMDTPITEYDFQQRLLQCTQLYNKS